MGRTKGKVVMVFGVFDGLHRGHISFLEQARQYGAMLLVVVARDEAVRQLKDKIPFQSERMRLALVRRVPSVSRALLGDHIQSSYRVLGREKPDVICVGYDQRALEQDLKRYMRARGVPFPRLVRLERL